MKIQHLILESALKAIAPDAVQYVNEVAIGGYHSDPAQQKYPSGAIWGAEGQFLYALVRHFKPVNVLEVGTGRGVGTLHLAAAVEKNANGATLITVDSGRTGYKPAKTPAATYVQSDAVAYLRTIPDGTLDFIFEDLDHTAETVQAVAELAEQKLKTGGILISHDAAHYNVGKAVQEGYERAEFYVDIFLIEPCDCGLSFWQKLDEDAEPEDEPDYEAMTIPQLKELLEQSGAEDIPARAKKEKYIEMLKG